MTEIEIPRSTDRLLDLFEIVVAKGSCNLTLAAAEAELSPTTALRHLRALEARGYLVRDADGDFSVGPTFLRIAASLQNTGTIDRLLAVAQPRLDALAELTGESSYLSVADGRKATYIATAPGTRSIRHVGGVGQEIDLESSAIGAALRNPGVAEYRTGAVEPDIAAVALVVGSYAKLQVVVSIVGPAHRIDEAQMATLSAHLHEGVANMRRLLELDEEAVAS